MGAGRAIPWLLKPTVLLLPKELKLAFRMRAACISFLGHNKEVELRIPECFSFIKKFFFPSQKRKVTLKGQLNGVVNLLGVVVNIPEKGLISLVSHTEETEE